MFQMLDDLKENLERHLLGTFDFKKKSQKTSKIQCQIVRLKPKLP